MATKKYPSIAVNSLAFTGILAGGVVYSIQELVPVLSHQSSQEQNKNPFYIAMIIATSMLNAFLLYHLQRSIRLEKLPKIRSNEIVSETTYLKVGFVRGDL